MLTLQSAKKVLVQISDRNSILHLSCLIKLVKYKPLKSWIYHSLLENLQDQLCLTRNTWTCISFLFTSSNIQTSPSSSLLSTAEERQPPENECLPVTGTTVTTQPFPFKSRRTMCVLNGGKCASEKVLEIGCINYWPLVSNFDLRKKSVYKNHEERGRILREKTYVHEIYGLTVADPGNCIKQKGMQVFVVNWISNKINLSK